MPQRILRDWTDSEPVDNLSFQAEVLLTRLIMKADDFGSYHANPKLLNAFCFPLKNIRETDITRWLQELASSGLIVLYDAENKPFLNILNFNQRLRSMKRCFPQIPENVIIENCQQVAGKSRASCQPEVEVEVEVEEEGKRTIPPLNFKKITKEEFHLELKNYVEEFGKDIVTKFFNYWSEKDTKGKMKFQKQDTWETKLRLITWKNNEGKWNK
ncbi:uncharacterized protein CHSO_1063 [Chryseobacterium sp. StRB126]|uniref:hypothetical protein n=1 Tax=Chryseobacterium sp. StRB126 TaxID=878220 RepID=UPI0004E988E2|nr:hypothetical protein [Chryseobacterium sp. StRB126]BAP30100.1 uncharacterized protein CHSO_1063 [Chryseobacterium sp. StRB126]